MEEPHGTHATTYQVTLGRAPYVVQVTSDRLDAAQDALTWALATYDALRARYQDPKAQPPAIPVSEHQPLAGLVRAAVAQFTGGEKAPLCAVHQVPMHWRETARGNFWSCNQKNDNGSWCRYRPTTA